MAKTISLKSFLKSMFGVGIFFLVFSICPSQGQAHTDAAKVEACKKACEECKAACKKCQDMAGGTDKHDCCARAIGKCQKVLDELNATGDCSADLCEDCAKACDECAKGCEGKHGHHEGCADAARKCAEACRDMKK